MTKYLEAFSWTSSIQAWLDQTVGERPVLNVCSGRQAFGDVSIDLYEPANVRGNWMALPFHRDSFGAVFADPPWDAEYKRHVAQFIREALRVAPIVYLMAPWTYGAAWAPFTHCWVRYIPGVNRCKLLSRQQRI